MPFALIQDVLRCVQHKYLRVARLAMADASISQSGQGRLPKLVVLTLTRTWYVCAAKYVVRQSQNLGS